MFAHGDEEIRHPKDPLPPDLYPENSNGTSVHPSFKGKISLGAVHSNYKTLKCRNKGKCPFGIACSYYHSEKDRRKLTDPIPKLPHGVLLPPPPKCIRFKDKNK